MSCEQLQTEFGIDRIPHGRAAAFYEKLLKGQMEELVPLPALEDDMAEGAVPRLQPEAAQQPDRNASEIGSVLGDREVEDEEDLDSWIDMLEEQLSRQQFEDVAESAVVPAAPAPEEDGHGPDPEPDSILPAAVAVAVADRERGEVEEEPAEPGPSMPGPQQPQEPHDDDEVAGPEDSDVQQALRAGAAFSWDGFMFGAFRFTTGHWHV